MTNKPEQLPEWRKSLNEAVENYQSTRAWYEENQDSPSAEQDMDAAAGEIAKLIKQYGVLIVLNLLDEIDELQEHRKADSEPVGIFAKRNGTWLELCSGDTFEHPDAVKLFAAPQPAPVVPDAIEPDYEVIKAILPTANPDEYACCIAADMWNACRAAMLEAGNSLVTPDGYVLVPNRLTAENGAKGVLSGEFSETKFINCPECFGDDECETCDGSGRIEITVPVTWTTIKAIWAKGVEHFAAAPQQEVKR